MVDEWKRFRELTDQMTPFIRAADWAGLESCFQRLAREMSRPAPPEDLALPGLEDYQREMVAQFPWAHAEREISAVDLADYSSAFSDLLRWSYRRARTLSARAIYLEYDLDNDWSSNLFFYHGFYEGYRPEAAGDDAWACEYIDKLEGPALPEFAQLFVAHGGLDASDDAQVGASLYLIARTVAAFGRAVSALPRPDFAVCIGYHDQGRITRIIEAAP